MLLGKRTTITMLGLLVCGGCQPQAEYKAPGPSEVQVATPLQRTVTNYLEETGTTEAVQQVEVRARVRGFIDEVRFEPFTDVEAGDVLFVIEPEQYEVAVAASKAAVAVSQVEIDRAKIEYERQQQMFRQNATPERELVAAKADYDAALATLEATKAQLNRAQIDLDYTRVKAPIKGRVGKAFVKLGNLVDGNEATPLTTIINYDQVFANFYISERQLLEYSSDPDRERLRRSPTIAEKQEMQIDLGRENDLDYPFKGHFDYADLAVDKSTGTYEVRGIFDNSEKEILPGLFVKLRMPLGQIENAILVPEFCLGSDQAGSFVLVVNSQNVVERRSVDLGLKQKLGATPFIVIRRGLTPEDRVVVNGLQRARPGATVAPELVAFDQATP